MKSYGARWSDKLTGREVVMLVHGDAADLVLADRRGAAKTKLTLPMAMKIARFVFWRWFVREEWCGLRTLLRDARARWKVRHHAVRS